MIDTVTSRERSLAELKDEHNNVLEKLPESETSKDALLAEIRELQATIEHQKSLHELDTHRALQRERERWGKKTYT